MTIKGDPTREQLIQDYEIGGLPIVDLALKYGMSPMGIKYRLQVFNIPSHKKKIEWNEEQLRQEYQVEKLTQIEIAQKYNVSEPTIRLALKKFGIEVPSRDGRRKFGSDNPGWRGNKAKYGAFHTRVEVLRGLPDRCEICGSTDPTKRYDWANLTGHYDDTGDYLRMCSKCHSTYDTKLRAVRKQIESSIRWNQKENKQKISSLLDALMLSSYEYGSTCILCDLDKPAVNFAHHTARRIAYEQKEKIKRELLDVFFTA